MVRESRKLPKKSAVDERDQLRLVSDYHPAGDQAPAIAGLVAGLEDGLARQVLLGVTGSGKTFTIANVIAKIAHTIVFPGLKKIFNERCQFVFFDQNFLG